MSIFDDGSANEKVFQNTLSSPVLIVGFYRAKSSAFKKYALNLGDKMHN